MTRRQPGSHLWEKIRALGLPAGDHAVFGSGPLVVRGLVEYTNDIDIIARGAAWEEAINLGPAEVAPKGDRVVRLGADGVDIEIFAGWLGLDTDAIVDGSELIGGLPFARLEDVLAFKRNLGRPKDLEHVRLIEGYRSDRERRDRDRYRCRRV